VFFVWYSVWGNEGYSVCSVCGIVCGGVRGRVCVLCVV